MVSAELLRRVVEGRLQPCSDGDSPDAQLVLEAAIDQFRPANTEDQPVTWYGRRWLAKPEWHSTTRNRIEALCDKLDPSKRNDALIITRRDVFDRCDDATDLFLAAMAWGFGATGYGCWRTAEMINPGGESREQRILEAVGAYRTAWSSGGAAAVAQAWTLGNGKVAGLGPAFASKVAYFAVYERNSGAGPLIADINTTWSVWALGGIWDSRYSPGNYSDYVQWCERWAHALGRRSDDIERALFNVGPAIRLCYSGLSPNRPADDR